MATIVSPRARFLRTSDPILVPNHFDRLIPNKEIGMAATRQGEMVDPKPAPIFGDDRRSRKIDGAWWLANEIDRKSFLS